MKKNKKTPLFSVIIATKNEEKNIVPLIQSLKKQTCSDIEIIVVDNHSSDKTLKFAQIFGVKTLTKGPERSTQRNFGAVCAQGKYLVFLDADMQLPMTILEECKNEIIIQKAKVIIIPETSDAISFYGSMKRLEKKLYEGEDFIEAPRCIYKKLFFEIGGYDRRLIAGEDWDLAARLKMKSNFYRTQTPLIHRESFLKTEIQNKLYYAKCMKVYWKLHPDLKIHQAGLYRASIFWKKKRLLLSNPFTGCALVLLKSAHYIISLLA